MTLNSKEIIAAELMKAHRIDDAKVIYQELIQSGLATYLSYANLAVIYAQRNQLNKALFLALKALHINQNSSDVYNTLEAFLKRELSGCDLLLQTAIKQSEL